MDAPQLVNPFSLRSTFRLFPVWGYNKWSRWEFGLSRYGRCCHFSWVRPRDRLAESFVRECLRSESTARVFLSMSKSLAIAHAGRSLIREGFLIVAILGASCVVASHGSFSLHFPKHYRFWPSFHVLLYHPCVYFDEASVYIFCHFVIELSSFIVGRVLCIYSRYKSFLRFMPYR